MATVLGDNEEFEEVTGCVDVLDIDIKAFQCMEKTLPTQVRYSES